MRDSAAIQRIATNVQSREGGSAVLRYFAFGALTVYVSDARIRCASVARR